MSLGLTRDSVLDLASLASEAEARRETNAKNNRQSSESQLKEGESADIQLDLSEHEASDRTKRPEKQRNSSYGQYSGFTVDKSNYGNYHTASYEYNVDPYAPVVLGGRKGGKNIFCCLFAPWMVKDEDRQLGDGLINGALESKKKPLPHSTAAKMQPSAKGQQLELESDPNAAKTTSKPAKPKEDPQSGKKGRRGILKRQSVANVGRPSMAEGASAKGSRRSLFPQYEEKPKKEEQHHCRFAPMARVVAVRSHKHMSHKEKIAVWWQKKDYDDFKKTGRLVAKAMLEGGSEVWLATNKSWQMPKVSAISRSTSEQSPKAYHMLDRVAIVADGKKATVEDSDKWWHKFGHSRRGLEHIASIAEGRERQANVRLAIRAVVDEQKRQKIYRRRDAEKLRMLSLQYTTWARELALAAAASDAEAVEGNFRPDRNTREFYLMKQARANGGFSKQLPAFMLPSAITPQMLDANTSSQLRYKRKQSMSAPQPIPASKPPADSTLEVVKETDQPSGGGSMAKRAAGFGTESGANMAAILSGMGTGAVNAH